MRYFAKVSLLAIVFCHVCATAYAGVKTSEITIKVGAEEIKAFLAEPEGAGPYPGVVVIQEWWGLNDWIKENAKRLAELGYVALAPDLYRGKVTDDPAVARQLLQGLPRDRAVRDLKSAVSDLVNRANVQKDKIGAIGWCMGGGYALQLALNEPRVQACVICYGAVVTDPARLQTLNAAVLGIFGERDKGIKAQDVRQFEEALKKAGKKVEAIKMYDADHGFMRAMNSPGKKNPVHNADATSDAWKQIEMFFAKTLGGKRL
jgi:carboxymethylenebutenolidase